MRLIEINWNPKPGRLRLFAGLLPVFALLAAWLMHSQAVSTWLAAGLIATASAVSLMGLIRPAWFRPVYVVWMVLGLPVSWLLSHGILLLLYFGVLTPLGCLLRCCRYDPMRRRPDTQSDSYWTDHIQAEDHRRYFRQY